MGRTTLFWTVAFWTTPFCSNNKNNLLPEFSRDATPPFHSRRVSSKTLTYKMAPNTKEEIKKTSRTRTLSENRALVKQQHDSVSTKIISKKRVIIFLYRHIEALDNSLLFLNRKHVERRYKVERSILFFLIHCDWIFGTVCLIHYVWYIMFGTVMFGYS